MKNKYAQNCSGCDTRVPANAGTLSRVGRLWQVQCLDCTSGAPIGDAEALELSRGNSISYGVVTSTGWVGYRNRQGRCEDSPCCGCCTF